MSRPLYEEAQDRRNELEVIRILEKKWPDYSFKKLPSKYYVDFAAIHKDGITAWVEIKCRNNNHNLYKTYMISMDKVIHGLSFAEKTNKDFTLFVRWKDVIGWVTIDSIDKYSIEIGGRKDRGDTQDVEPVIHIPIEDFKIITWPDGEGGHA